ncbi:MAG: 1-deoxy-D-xylulose-5-phosphate reductoisomerase [Xanthomonadales bacterium]|jgi:1-deoxy-D-xylulose-5-phosphate reductoisomerase|nr:1-deoxy-D-xylulose-5-phosphate reductoisomerase [Xanthomonadales bacterium]
MQRGITILGATGSIGISTLDVLSRHPDRYRVEGLSGHSNPALLAELCARHGARRAVISDPAQAEALERALAAAGSDARIQVGSDALLDLVADDAADTVMAAIVGAAGLAPTLHAAKLGKRILLANKESMVIAGPLFRRVVEASGAEIVPVDSEHNALFQSLPEDFARKGLAACGVRRLILTASGGPFLHTEAGELATVTPEQACAHPNWDMGRKISVDSATLMNKGLEVIEARWLFDADPDTIEVVVHPQSIIHSMVSYADGSVLAQLGNPDMRTPIAHALAWPERIASGVGPLDLAAVGTLEFHAPDLNRFPCLGLAFRAMRAGGSAAATLNAANEIAVQAFLDREIAFMAIPGLVESVLDEASWNAATSLEDIMRADREARALARRAVQQLHPGDTGHA